MTVGPGTFVEQARRAQIIEAATRALAELGFAGASMVRIARRIGVSRSLLNYHFHTRELLIEAVVEEIFAAGRARVAPEIERARTATDRLAAFISGSVAFYRESPHRIRALGEIIHGTRTSSWQPVRRYGDQELHNVGDLLREGQDSGEFRDFDVSVMARSIRRSLDGLIDAWTRDPELDLDHYRDELLRLFVAATRR